MVNGVFVQYDDDVGQALLIFIDGRAVSTIVLRRIQQRDHRLQLHGAGEGLLNGSHKVGEQGYGCRLHEDAVRFRLADERGQGGHEYDLTGATRTNPHHFLDDDRVIRKTLGGRFDLAFSRVVLQNYPPFIWRAEFEQLVEEAAFTGPPTSGDDVQGVR